MRIALVAGGQTAEATGTLGSAAQLADTARSAGHAVEIVALPDDRTRRPEALAAVGRCDIAIPLVAGLEGTFELLGIPYVGSPPDAAALAAHKGHFNAMVSALGLNKVPYEVYDLDRDEVPVEVPFEGPWYVKPARLGASFGITRVDDGGAVADAVRDAARHDSIVLIEQEVPRPFVEVEVAAVVGETVLLSPPMEIVAPGAVWRDSTWKYSIDERPTAFDDAAVASTCTDVVRLLIARIGLAGAMRFDLFVSASETVYVGEVNALPGHGVASMFPRIFEHAGVDRVEQLTAMLDAGLVLSARSGSLRVRA